MECEACPEGTRARPTPARCCPECVPVDEEACREGQAAYAARRAELEEELRSCKTDDDCMLASFGDACTASCPQALNKESIGPVASRLREEAAVHCELCFPPQLSCPPLPTKEVVCAAGRCELARPKG